MGTASARLDVPYPAGVPEALWLDPDRWAAFVDGFGQLSRVGDGWPRVGTAVVWQSTPGGRGEVTETVVSYEPRAACVLAVEDATLTGTQTIAFLPREDGCTLKLTLAYRVKERTALTPVVDLFFIRRAQVAALRRTLQRFAFELREDEDPAG